jgi:hypothetical protein
MKKSFQILWLMVCIFAINMVITSCASSPAKNNSLMEIPVLTVNPGRNESVIIIQRKDVFAGSFVSMKVWVDDEEVLSSIRSGQEVQLLIPDGKHSIRAGSTSVDKGKEISFEVTGEAISFLAEPKFGVFSARFNLIQTGKMKL